MKILNTEPTDINYNKLYNKFPFELDIFQKNSIISIENGENVLVTAHTGSGKTLVAEYAIMKSIKDNKKIIYTSPIKSLSNQKFSEFKNKFKESSIGILTGDIKFNPFGDILIMTTEILRNILYRHNNSSNINNANDTKNIYDVDINFDDIEIVVFDEIHYINDIDRGKVWEECIIMLPKHIKLVLLSATIDRAEEFVSWIEKVRERETNLIPTLKRNVPLTHYYYIYGKSVKPNIIDTYGNKLVPLLDSNNCFNTDNYSKLLNIKNNYEQYTGNKFFKYKSLFNPLIDFLITNNLCPAIMFIFSRKKCEEYAGYVTKNLITVPEQAEIERIIDSKLLSLHNYDKYTQLEQFRFIKSLLMKGVCIHHSGLVPIFKELIEILFSMNLVKLLFATETFAVGVNMPTKTVLFSDLKKRDNTKYRTLLTHEYIQMSGRAGRRGLDKIGHVIHLPNLFELLPTTEIQKMMLGKSQHIESKFIIDYQFVLKSINNNLLLDDVTKNSLLNTELEKRNRNLIESKNEYERFLNSTNFTDIQIKQFDQYSLLINNINAPNNMYIKFDKKNENNRKQQIKKLESIPQFKANYSKYNDYKKKLDIYKNITGEIEYNSTYLEYYYKTIIKILEKNGFIIDNISSTKGTIASIISDCNCILLTELIAGNYLNDLSYIDIATILGIFLDTKADHENCCETLLDNLNISSDIKSIISKLTTISNEYQDFEISSELYLNVDWNIYLDMVEITNLWVQGKTLAELQIKVFEGNFVKDMIKLHSICETVDKVSLVLQNIELSNKIKEIKKNIMRDIVTTDSLYIL